MPALSPRRRMTQDEDKENDMRKLKMLLVVAVAAVPFAPVAAQASHPDCQYDETCAPPHECTILTCPFMCPVDLPVEIGPDAIFFHDRPLLGWITDCRLV